MAKDIKDYLNNILEYLYDSADCYEKHVENVSDNNLKELFSYLSQQRLLMIDEIKSEIQRLGGEPKNSRTIIGQLHELYENLKSIITSGNPLAITKEIKRGENMLIESYKEIFKQEPPEKTKSLLLSHLNQLEDELKHVDMNSVTTA
jgi:uncharacterized protein (TIGR02284 family)